MADKAQDPKAADRGPQAGDKAQAHPLADPDSPRGFTETVTDEATQGSTELPKTPKDLEERAEQGIPSVQKGAPEQVAENKIAEHTGGAGEPYVGHGDDQPGGQPDPMKGKK